jgi:hypothetical protein
MTRGDRAIQERGLDRVQLLPGVAANRDQTVRTVPVIFEVLVALQATKVLKDFGETPTPIPQRRPPVINLWRPTQRETCVRSRAPTHDPSSRYRNPPVQLRVRGIPPVVTDSRLRRVKNITRKSTHVRAIRARLNKHHPTTGVLAQSRPKNATSRTTPDDYNVIPHSTNLAPQP